MQFRGVLDGQHAPGWINGGEQHIEQGGLARVGRATDDHVGVICDLIDQIVTDGWCHASLIPRRCERMLAADREAQMRPDRCTNEDLAAVIAGQDAGELWIVIGIELETTLVGETDGNPLDGGQCKGRIFDLALAFPASFSHDAVGAVHADFDG